jgi:hypothetical protein
MMFVMNIGTMAEFSYGTLLIPDYGRTYFPLIDHQNYIPTQSDAIDSVKAILFFCCFVLFMSFTSVYLATLENEFCWGPNSSPVVAGHGHEISTFIRLLIPVLYFSTTTLSTTGYGDIHPCTGSSFGYTASILLHLQTIGLFIFAITVFSNRSRRVNG